MCACACVYACMYVFNVLFVLFEILAYTRASMIISVELIQYDTDWPRCDWTENKVCDPKCEVCF
jgi:hypothetical protein